MKAVILAGGKGTRLSTLSQDIPKPMVPIGDKPLLEHQVDLLKRYGITEITIITGHLSSVIEEYFGAGTNHGVTIKYFVEHKPMGTTGGLKELENEFKDDFILFYGDVMLDMDLNTLIRFHHERKGLATLVLHPNDHPHDSDLVELDEEQRIFAFHPKPHDPHRYYHNMVNAALYVLSPKIFAHIQKGKKADFGKDIFPAIYESEGLFGYPTTEYLKDVGTPDRLAKVTKDFHSGRIERFNRKHKRAAIFIDRDGVIVQKVNLLHKVKDIELFPFSGEAICRINASEYLAVVVTNQSVIARGLCSLEELDEIHKKMETLLGKEGAKLDGIYFCPHHPEKGFPNERMEYKIVCDCRKPSTGMILQATKQFNIDLSRSVIIGDSFRDIECGKNAGIQTIGVRTGDGSKKLSSKPDHIADNILEAVTMFLK